MGARVGIIPEGISMPGERTRPLPIARWLLAVAALIVLMIVVGGITRLTESGLSITRWNPIAGAIPPGIGLRTQAMSPESPNSLR